MNKTDMIYDLSVIWSAVKEVFPYLDRLAFDWDEQYRCYLEKILEISSEADFHHLLTDFVESLNDGHTKYIPPSPFRTSKPYKRADSPSAVFKDGILTVRINDFMSDHSAYVKEQLEAASEASLVCLDIRDNIGGNTLYAAKVAELFITGQFSGCRKWTQVRSAVETAGASQLLNCSESRLLQYIKDGMTTREAVTNAKNVLDHTKYNRYTDSFGNPGSKAMYEGPLHILISKRTMSAAEDFAAMFKSNRRGTLIGEPTYGSTGTPYMLSLRCGGRAQVVSVGYSLLDGTEFIGKGIMPDIAAEEII